MTRAMAVALVLAGCTRASAPSRDHGTDPVADPRPAPGAPADAYEEKTARNGNTHTPPAGNSDAEVEANIERIADEHPSPGRADAEEWLVANADRSHARMIELAESRKIDLRVTGAFRVLGRMGRAEDVPVLARLAAEQPRTSGAWDAGAALAASAAPEATRALLDMAENTDQEVAGDALIHLGTRRDESTRAFVEGKLSDKRQLIRFKAARALEFMGSAQSVAALQARLQIEKDDEVRDAIKDALAKAAK